MGDKRPPSKLSEIQPDVWPSEYTSELLAVLRVLTRLVAIEPKQDALLARIVDGPIIDADTLRGAGALSDASADVEQAVEDDAE
jgi:hypothetical protein